MTKRALVTAGLLSLALAVPAVAGATVKFFLSPNGNASCQVSSGGALGTIAYCQTIKPLQSVKLHRNGFFTVCKGVRCIGNPPDNATTLKAGHSVTVGPFVCSVDKHNAVTCFVSKTGKGFVISRSGITKITVRKGATL